MPHGVNVPHGGITGLSGCKSRNYEVWTSGRLRAANVQSKARPSPTSRAQREPLRHPFANLVTLFKFLSHCKNSNLSNRRNMASTEDGNTVPAKDGNMAAVEDGTLRLLELCTTDKPWWRVPHLVKLNMMLLVPFITSYVGGFDSSMLNGIQTLPQWQEGELCRTLCSVCWDQ